MSQHFIIKCKCGNVIAQCRCPGPDKAVELRETCQKCTPTDFTRKSVEAAVEAMRKHPALYVK